MKFSDLKLGVCKSVASESVYNSDNLDGFCFNQSRLLNYFAEKARHNHHFGECKIAYDSTLDIPYTPLTTTLTNVTASLFSDKYDSCTTMRLVFGVGSAVALVATTVKILCQQCHVGRLNHSGISGSKLRKAANIILNDGLLLGASGLGSTVLVSSLIDSCGPVDADAKKIVLTLTVLYGTSAGSKVLGALVGRKVPKRKL